MPPPINQALVASVGIAAATVVVAAAVAIYQDPEVRRRTDELRRRIAIALRSLGDNVDPNAQPRFNRPEDAHGFYESHTVDADDETRRRQREELMYWNALRESQQLKRQPTSPHGSTFEDFLQPDSTGERGTLVYNTGANAWDDSNNNMVRRRGGNTEGVRGLNASMIANPFNDEYGIELDEQPRIDVLNLIAPSQDEAMSDIYNASPVLRSATPAQPPPPMTPLSNGAADPNVLFDFDSQSETVDSRTEYDTAMDAELNDGARTPTTARSVTLDREFAEDEYMTTSNDDEEDERNAAYASIQAWAQNSTSGFYSPLPVTPAAPLSEAEFISEGHLTPTDSASVVDVGYDAASSRGGDYDVLSDSDDGIATPGSWSEVGSIISESESALRA